MLSAEFWLVIQRTVVKIKLSTIPTVQHSLSLFDLIRWNVAKMSVKMAKKLTSKTVSHFASPSARLKTNFNILSLEAVHSHDVIIPSW